MILGLFFLGNWTRIFGYLPLEPSGSFFFYFKNKLILCIDLYYNIFVGNKERNFEND